MVSMRVSQRPLLGEVLLAAGLITPHQLEEARHHQQQTGQRLGQALVSLGYASEDDVAWALSRQLRLPYIHLTPDMLQSAAVTRVPFDAMEREAAVPILEADNTLTVVMADPTDHEAVAEIEQTTGMQIVAAVGLGSNIRGMLEYLRSGRLAAPDSTPALTAFRFHLSAAVRAGASEIYFDAHPKGTQIRYRTPRGLLESPGPSLTAGDLQAALRAIGTPLTTSGDARFIVEALKTGLPVDIVLMHYPSRDGETVVGTIHDAAAPDAASFPALAPEVTAVFRELADTGGLAVVGTPDPRYRALMLSRIASIVPADRRRVVGVSTGGMGLDGVIEVDRAGAIPLLDGRVDVLLANIAGDMGAGAEFGRLRRPGQLLILGTAHAHADAVVGDLLRHMGTWWIPWTHFVLLTGLSVPALCTCARPLPGPPPEWTQEPRPSAWAEAVGCDRCKYTGFQGDVFVHTWHRAGDFGQDLAATPERVAAAYRARFEPALREQARRAVERLSIRPSDVLPLFRR